MGMHRIRLLKELAKEQKVPKEEYVEMVRQKMNKAVRLSEAECSDLTPTITRCSICGGVDPTDNWLPYTVS